MRPVIIIALLFVAAAVSYQVKLPAQSTPKESEVVPKDPDIWRATLSNVHKDPGEEYGHGEGDSLTLLVRGETAVGELSELEGSQQDPSPICLTGTFHESLLHLENHPTDFTYDVAPISVDGKVSANAQARTFHGRITGGPFHSDPKGSDPHFPAVVTLRSVNDALEDDAATIADDLATSSCTCQWKKHVRANSFITAICDSPTKNEQ